MGFKFGARSRVQVNSCHPDLQKILNKTIEISDIDFGVSEGHRPTERQQELYAIGRTKDLHKKPVTQIDGITKKGKHNHKPSLAADIYIWHDNKATRQKIAYDNVHLAYVMGLMQAVAKELHAKGEITYALRWGGNWDRDNILVYDQNFDDLPHVELVAI